MYQLCSLCVFLLVLCTNACAVRAAPISPEELWHYFEQHLPDSSMLKEWGTLLENPEGLEYELFPTDKWWNPKDARMVTHPVDAKHWYERKCCSNRDCRGFSASLVHEVVGGVELILPPYNDFPGATVFFPQENIQPRPRGATGDVLWHFCFTVLRHRLTHELVFGRMCVYPPPPNA